MFEFGTVVVSAFEILGIVFVGCLIRKMILMLL